MKKGGIIHLILIGLILVFFINIISSQDELGSIPVSGTTSPTPANVNLGKLDSEIGDNETYVGELFGLGQARNNEISVKNVKLVRG